MSFCVSCWMAAIAGYYHEADCQESAPFEQKSGCLSNGGFQAADKPDLNDREGGSAAEWQL
ncbi:hypothetical protein CHELA40_11214 [Chelatococcus asaccharovorans]|nr:hypothetical protein CHELA40_11214 [Chelatococcus asaccharovorans]CAH1685211.1 hypothetical protein CHELA17_64386 [Chelatococcus asaccharovorans]